VSIFRQMLVTFVAFSVIRRTEGTTFREQRPGEHPVWENHHEHSGCNLSQVRRGPAVGSSGWPVSPLPAPGRPGEPVASCRRPVRSTADHRSARRPSLCAAVAAPTGPRRLASEPAATHGAWGFDQGLRRPDRRGGRRVRDQQSAVSRGFVRASAAAWKASSSRRLDGTRFVAVCIDGVEYAGETIAGSPRCGRGGEEQILGLWSGAALPVTETPRSRMPRWRPRCWRFERSGG